MTSKFSLDGRVAIVTGGGTGIGRACAMIMAEYGANLVLAGLYAQPLDETAKAIENLGRQALPVKMDVTDKEQCQNLIDATLERFGHVDILVNAAGGGQLKPIDQWLDKEWDDLFALNLDSVWQLSRKVSVSMLKQGKGAIVNISSAASITAMPQAPAYAAAKAGVNSLTRSMAAAWTAKGIRVNAIACGAVRAATLTDELDRMGVDHDSMGRVNGSGRLGEPDEIGHCALFLASDAASFCSGQTLVVDGGPKAPIG